MDQPLPLIILAGSDQRDASVSPTGQQGSRLVGNKGVLPLPNGRILVAELMRRYAETGRFTEPVLIGPRQLYEPHALGCEIVDASHDIGETLSRGVEVIRARFGMQAPVAISMCDILPSASEIRGILESAYDPVSDCAFWGQLIEASPAEMGASSWKPSYRFVREDGSGSINVYPGHLIVLRAAALRVEVITGLARLAYQHRNQPLQRRIPDMLARGMMITARYDLHNLARLQLSTATVSVPWQCLSSYARYRKGLLSVSGFERAFGKSFVRNQFARKSRVGPVVFSVCHTLSLAKDLDTQAEFDEAVRALAC